MADQKNAKYVGKMDFATKDALVLPSPNEGFVLARFLDKDTCGEAACSFYEYPAADFEVL